MTSWNVSSFGKKEKMAPMLAANMYFDINSFNNDY